MALGQPEDMLRTGEFVSTGSSQASALVSGILALLLQLEPDLTPDELKCKLITSAEPAINSDGLLAYSPFQQGYGYVTASRALLFGQNSCDGLNLLAEMKGEEHFYGPAIVQKDGSPGLPAFRGKVSAEPSEKGLSVNRKWGVKDHIEQRPATAPGAALPHEMSFDWQKFYLQEKAIVDSLGNSISPVAP